LPNICHGDRGLKPRTDRGWALVSERTSNGRRKQQEEATNVHGCGAHGDPAGRGTARCRGSREAARHRSVDGEQLAQPRRGGDDGHRPGTEHEGGGTGARDRGQPGDERWPASRAKLHAEREGAGAGVCRRARRHEGGGALRHQPLLAVPLRRRPSPSSTAGAGRRPGPSRKCPCTPYCTRR
jgi:hypothetical protein